MTYLSDRYYNKLIIITINKRVTSRYDVLLLFSSELPFSLVEMWTNCLYLNLHDIGNSVVGTKSSDSLDTTCEDDTP